MNEPDGSLVFDLLHTRFQYSGSVGLAKPLLIPQADPVLGTASITYPQRETHF